MSRNVYITTYELATLITCDSVITLNAWTIAAIPVGRNKNMARIEKTTNLENRSVWTTIGEIGGAGVV